MDRHLYFAKPDFLQLTYTINPWMNLDTPFSLQKAKEQHNNLVETYKAILGNEKQITVIEPREGLTELCFYGDSVFAIGNKALFGRFLCEERYMETEYVI